MAGLALPAIASAHGGPAYSSGGTATPPTLDGTITPAEWADAPAYTLSFGNIPATVRFEQTATDLYVGVVVQDLAVGTSPSLSIFFDNNHDGVKANGDDVWLDFAGGVAQDFYYSSTGTGGASHYNDTTTGGTNETVAAGRSASGAATFEIRHPLCSSDTAHDICAQAGQTLGVDFQYEPGTSGFVNAPGSNLFDPSANWADLLLAATDAVAPVVSVTQPSAGSVLRGTVDVAATATDNVGVSSVEFSYFGGSPRRTVVFATDTTAPYTARFDTTQVQNSLPLDATIYATARDAAGNTTAVGNGVTIDNPAASKIVFETDRDSSTYGDSELYSMDPDGSHLVRLTTSPGIQDTRPSVSPDGMQIAWQRGGQVWLMNADGTNPRALTDQGQNVAPAFSPDGSQIAFESTRTGTSQIYVMNADGSNQTRITNDAFNDASPSWTPAGTQLTFDSDRSGNRDIYIMNADGTRQLDLTANSAASDSDAEVSPDGRRVVFVSGRSGFTSVWTMNIDGTNAVDASQSRNFDADPTWSPDGQYIAFTRDNTGGITFNVWTMRADGSVQVRITGATSQQRNSFSDWASLPSPPSATIAISSNTPSIGAGAATVPLSAIPASALTGRGAGSSTTNAPLDTIPLDTIPLDTIPLDTIPLDTIPLDTIGFNTTTLARTTLGTIPLDTIPLSNGKRWEGLLASTVLGGVPINTLSLLDVATSASSVLHSLRLEDLANSPLDTIPLAAVTLTTSPLDTIPIQGHTGAANQTDWCNLIHAVPGFASFDCTGIGTQTVLGLTMRGVPLDTIPLDTIPLDTIDLRNTPLDTIPLDTIPLNNLQSSPLDTIPLDTIDFSLSPLDTIPLDTINAPTVADCTTATFPCDHSHTLGGAFRAGLLKPGATFGQLGHWPGVTLGNVGRGLPPSVKLHDLLALLIVRSYDWEQLPLTFPVQDYSTGGGVATYTASFTVGGGPTVNGDVTVKLSNGGRYVAGSTSVTGLSGTAPEPVATQSGPVETLVWHFRSLSTTPGTYTLGFKARGGLVLGPLDATASIAVGSATAAASPVTVDVHDTFEPNDLASPQGVATQQLTFSYLTSASDRDYYTLPVPALGTETKLLLSHLPADYDLIVYGPTQQALRAAPLDTIPLDTIPANDGAPTFQQQSQSLSPESLQDIPVTPVPANQSLLGVSDVRGTGDEEIDLVSTGGGGTYTIEVVGFNGAFSTKPYVLRAEQEAPQALPACQARTMTGGGTAVASPSIPANVDTLFLVNAKQLGDVRGSAGETQVMTALNQVVSATNLGIVGAVVPVENDTTVAQRYGAWNQNPCDPVAANDVVRSITALLDGIRSTHASIKNIVLVGGDDIIPMGRLADPTPLSNEANYASTFGYASNNELVSSFAAHFLLSDDVYGDVSATTFPGGQLYVPEQALGRLVDTPGEIAGQLNQFRTAGGQLNPQTELTSGYDFLADGATKEAAALRAGRTAPQGDLISNTWTRDQLTGAMFPATGTAPQIMAINAHYNQRQLLPADQSAAHRSDVLYTAAQLAAQGATAVQNRLALTIGCHSGVNAPDSIFSGTAADDWAQTYLGHGAFGFIGNTGYGLGDTVTVAYSEQLHVNLAKRLDGSVTLGQALIYAKQDYLGGLPQVTAYDAKVINEATLYGLPMWRIGNGTPPAPAPPNPTFIDPSTSKPAQAVTFTPNFTANTTAYGKFYSVNGETMNETRRPIEPTTSADVTEPDLTAHGFLITSLASTDESIDAAFSTPVNDSSKITPELVGLINFPTKLQSIRTVATPNGQRQRLVVAVGQYLSDGVPDAQGAGTQRRFTTLGGRVLYADPTVRDFTSPLLGAVDVVRVGSNVAFRLPVTDENGNDAVKRVLVLYQDGATWRSLDLSRVDNVWSGAGPIGAGTTVPYFIQAVDANGNVSVISAKGDLQPITVQQQSGPITFSISGTPVNGWYRAGVTVTFSAPVQESLDGAAFTGATSVGVDGSGVHTIDYAAGSSSGTVVVPIDATAPTIAFGSRSYVLGSSGNQFDYVCGDAGSGIDTCASTPAAPDTSTITTGSTTRQFSVHAVDRVGNATDGTGNYTVVYGFKGFFDPLSNLPFLNLVSAGSAVPVKFSLGGNQGLSIFASGSPVSGPTACDAQAPLDTTVPTVSAGSNSLTYDATSDQYTYVWKTDKAWAGTCRKLDIVLVDGTHHPALFKFK